MNEEATTDEEVKKPKTMLIIIIAAVAVVAIGGGVAFVVLGSGGEAPAEEGEAAAAALPAQAGSGPGLLVSLGDFVVNVQVGDMTSFLKASITIELERPEYEETITKYQPLIRNALVMHLSSLDIEDARTVEQKMALQEKMKTVVNERLDAEIVRGVFFTEFVTQ